MSLPETPSFDLTGKKALITGASSGVGLESACALAANGACVTIAARRTAEIKKIHNQMAAKGWKSNYITMDISMVEETSILINEIGPFDILVNGAGLARHSSMLDTTTEDFDKVMGVNVRGAYFLSQAVAKGMLNSGIQGSIINISSQMAHVGGLERAVYCASKFAVEGFTKSMAIELGSSKIRVNTVCPTFIKTAFTKKTFNDSEKMDWVLKKIKLERVGEVEDIMGAVLYLASDLSGLVTGSSMIVDGGWTAG